MDSIINDFAAGNITWPTGIIWYVIALIIGAAAGAVGGMIIGAEHMGKELAAMMGAFFGPIAAAPGVAVAAIVLAFI
jgi:hypothetical protein